MAVVHGLAGVQGWRGEGGAGHLGGEVRLNTIRIQEFNRNSNLCGWAGHLRGEGVVRSGDLQVHSGMAVTVALRD